MLEDRLVLMPQGLPPRIDMHEACVKLLLASGADIHRIFDSPIETVDRFASHLARAKVPLSSRPEPLVVLTKTSPIALAIFLNRKVLEKALPSLRRAAWLIFHDPNEDPFFGREVLSMGMLDTSLVDAPIWTTRGAGEYLVLTPDCPRRDLRDRVRDLLARVGPTSGSQAKPIF